MNTFNTDVINSLFTPKSVFSLMDLLYEITHKKTHDDFQVKKISFNQLEKWHFDAGGNLCHDSGKFFSIRGIKCNLGNSKKNNQQIIVNQPEVGILGIIAKKVNGILHFLMQMKFEPGNINQFQLSPSVQATKSNYTAVHMGRAVPLLLRFLSSSQSLFDISLSEQASRFYKKENRNIINLYGESEEIESYPNFIWLTLGQILDFVKQDNFVNMNTRSILSCIKLGERCRQYSLIDAEEYYGSYFPEKNQTIGKDFFISALDVKETFYSFGKIKSWITEKKKQKNKISELIPLKEILAIINNGQELYHGVQPDFKIIALKIEAEREVSSWCQPIISDYYNRIHGYLVKKINGVLHFLIKALEEIGGINGAEIGPTIQGIPVEQLETSKENFSSYFVAPEKKNVLLSVMQSDEGGRFFMVQNLHLIILTEDDLNLPNDYMWATLYQIKELIHLGLVNIEARSLISCINFKE